MWCLSPFLSKVISIKSALAGSPVPFFLRIKLWASVLGKINYFAETSLIRCVLFIFFFI